ncbi:hypothetical protein KDU71_21900 [Carboxylicivirga sediminis]|uniref:Outer membrane protein beta-barrel domain-containing protein n=1 Tax=Carboxylicivirga sediminis TaxID=2006564 RepID=A0A941F7A0_9BACT|nr:hypothetical protein [Carboxylicivirga sediminis]MBR8538241.1 hypothetical protein [Carboxylicivirga sediminis]
MKTALILLLVSISASIFAQSDYRSGYIISLSGDTIHGLIDFRGNVRNSLQCKFKSDDGTNDVYHPFDIHSYRFTDGKYYISKKVKQGKEESANVFVEYLVNGEKDLFYYRTDEANHYLISYDETTVVPLPYRESTSLKDGKYYGTKSTQHIGFLKSYFNDAPELYRQIESIQQPNARNLTKLTKAYHDLKCDSSACIIYAKTKNKFSMAIEPVFGYYKSKMFSDFNPQYGAHLFFWLPQYNENVYAKTGFLYTSNTALVEDLGELGEIDYKIYTVPAAFEYQMPFKRIKPKLDLGINAHFINSQGRFEGAGLSLAAGAGVMIKVTSFMYLDAEVTSDITGFAYETDLIQGVGYRGGIYFKL